MATGAPLAFYHIHKGRPGAHAHGEVNIMLFALLVININRVSSEFSLFKKFWQYPVSSWTLIFIETGQFAYFSFAVFKTGLDSVSECVFIVDEFYQLLTGDGKNSGFLF